jgi:formate dehydrogenase subunit gamma
MIERRYGTVGRYTPGAWVNHWLNAIILILLALSGMSLFHPALFFLSDLFGGGTWTRILHPWLGLALLVSFTGLSLRFWRYNLWERSDSLWMRHIGDVVTQHEENVPEVGRYNAGQKIVFWGV